MVTRVVTLHTSLTATSTELLPRPRPDADPVARREVLRGLGPDRAEALPRLVERELRWS